MIQDKKLLIIGAGNMAEALIQGLLNSQKMPRENITVAEIKVDRREYVCKKFGIQFYENIREGILRSEVILFAVKPQNILEVLSEFQGIATHFKIFITIAAGVKMRRFEEALGEEAHVIRVMPNMAALIGSGISGVSRGQFATDEDEDMACAMMETVGQVVRLPENQLDALTAISGSGPAYFFFLMEALQKAGTQLGLSPTLSSRLVEQTAVGASLLVQKTHESPENLRAKVTSRGGTTEAALHVLEEASVQEIVIRAVKMAEKKSKELSEGL